jgi:integrase
MTKRFTDIAIRNLRATAKRREIPDATPGLYVIVQPSGKKSFAVRYRIFGRPHKLTLPAGTSLAAARVLCAEARQQVAKHIDPVAEKKAANAQARASAADTVEAICREYLKREGPKLRTGKIRERTLERLVFHDLGKMPIESVKRSDLMRLIRKIEDGSGPRQADICLKYLSRIFGWYALGSDDFRSPIIKGMSGYNAKAHQRSRVLTDDELRAVWKASETGGAFGQLVRFLLLTAARRGEGAGLTRDEIDAGAVWLLPARRNKTKIDLARPLSAAAQAIVNAQPIIDGEPRVFGALSFAQGKVKFDLACGVTAWRLHDLRRSARSLMSRAGVRPDIGERVLGHVVGGVAGIYDRHGYIEQMRHAVDALAGQIELIVNPPSGVVTPMRRRDR